MQFTIPQFIEKEPKIIGPFTFKQFIFIGAASGVCVFFYFTTPLPVFIIAAIILLGSALALSFLTIKGIPLPTVIKNSFLFLFKPKIYLWKKKSFSPRLLKKEIKFEKPKEEIDKKPPLRLGGKRKLGELFNRLETKK